MKADAEDKGEKGDDDGDSFGGEELFVSGLGSCLCSALDSPLCSSSCGNDGDFGNWRNFCTCSCCDQMKPLFSSQVLLNSDNTFTVSSL